MKKEVFRYTEEHDQFLRDHVKGISVEELTKLFNEHFKDNRSQSGIANRKHKLGLKNGVNSGCFKKGQASWNKGKKGLTGANITSFKKGNVPKNKQTIGYERIDRDGYVVVKVYDKQYGGKKNWKYKHHIIYEQHYGTIPKDHAVIFADGNTLNFDKDNLLLVSRAELLYLNQSKLIYKDADLTKSGVAVAKVIVKAHKRKKERRE